MSHAYMVLSGGGTEREKLIVVLSMHETNTYLIGPHRYLHDFISIQRVDVLLPCHPD